MLMLEEAITNTLFSLNNMANTKAISIWKPHAGKMPINTPKPTDAALRSLRPGIDGLVLQFGHHRGTFLPQVWEQLPTPEAFLANLKRKAGLPPDLWDAQMKLSRYTVSKWREQDS